MKGTLEDDVTEADLISCVEFNHDGELLATGDKGGRVVIFQVSVLVCYSPNCSVVLLLKTVSGMVVVKFYFSIAAVDLMLKVQ